MDKTTYWQLPDNSVVSLGPGPYGDPIAEAARVLPQGATQTTQAAQQAYLASIPVPPIDPNSLQGQINELKGQVVLVTATNNITPKPG